MKRCTLALSVVLAMLACGCSEYRDTTDQQAGQQPDQQMNQQTNPQANQEADQNKTMYRGMARATLDQNSQDEVARLKAKSPELAKKFFDTAYGWAVFPAITQAGVGIGGARGLGVLYRHSHVVGYVTLSQASIGAQLGGQTYSEVIFFHDQDRFDDLKLGRFEFDATASVAAASDGAIATADYKQGVAVFTQHVTGLMFDASIGGQKFSDYEAK